jgi:lipopolysaccharide export system ATP-binding protein
LDPLILKTDSVQLEFDGRKILQDVYLACKQGEVLGILGRNGCGKSSLLRIIFGTLTPAYKHVSISGEYIKTGYKNRRIAYLPQDNYLPKGIKIKKLAKAIIDDRFWDDLVAHPVYYNYQEKTVAELSGGELRQLETLMVIYSKADFILLDEPFTHISPIQTEMFKAIIKKCAKVKGIMLTDHQYYNILDVSDRIILISDGYTRPIKHRDELVTYGYLSHIN